MKLLKILLLLVVAVGLLLLVSHYVRPGGRSLLDRGRQAIGTTPVGDDLQPQDRQQLDRILDQLPERPE